MKNAPLRGASRSPDALSYRTSRTSRTGRTSRRTPALFWKIHLPQPIPEVRVAPRQGCTVFSPGVEEGHKPRRRPRDSSAGRNPHDPARVSHLPSLPGECDTLSGSYLIMMINRFPGSSALRASTPGLKSGDPSGASPLRDRQAVAAGRGSVNVITQRQEASPLPLSSNASPVVDRGPARTIIFRTFPT